VLQLGVLYSHPQIVRFSEIRKMTLKSALEDVLGTTLAAVAGVVGKIEYVASLRDLASGAYSHWGLIRAHGEPAAQQALAEAHRLLFLRLLRTPLRTLRDDVIASGGTMNSSGALGEAFGGALGEVPGKKTTAREYMDGLRTRLPALIPQDLGGGSARHFSSVLHALSILVSNPVEARQEATPPA
jgi:hypothetical protein